MITQTVAQLGAEMDRLASARATAFARTAQDAANGRGLAREDVDRVERYGRLILWTQAERARLIDAGRS